MVQIIKTEDPRSKLSESLGMSLGQGIGNGLNTYFANRSLDSVLQDKALEGAPQSKKLEAIRSALSPYGEKGQEIFNQRMQIEQQEQQEKDLKKQERLQAIKGRAIGKLQAGEELSDEEWSRFTPQEVAALQKAQTDMIRELHQHQEAGKKVNADTLASAAFSKGYKAILDNDKASLSEVISDPNTPLSVKTQLGSIQNQFSQRADVKGRDANRRIDSVQNAYRKAISAERSRLGKFGGYRPEEVKAINDKITSLESSRNHDMQMLLNNPDNYARLGIWGTPEVSNYLPNDVRPQDQQEEEMEDIEEPTVVFNPSNPEHKELAKKLYKQYGDKEKVREILRQSFKGL